jgi:hypothetical protein
LFQFEPKEKKSVSQAGHPCGLPCTLNPLQVNIKGPPIRQLFMCTCTQREVRKTRGSARTGY